MRLLRTNPDGGFSLTWFIGDRIPHYAILSHRWEEDDQEVTLEDLSNGVAGSKRGYRKIQFCGEQAKNDRLEFFWVDSCCTIQTHHRRQYPTKRVAICRRKWRQNAPRKPSTQRTAGNLCDYSSECRWGRHFDVHTPVATEFPAIEIPKPQAPPPPEPVTSEGIMKPENCKLAKKENKVEKTDFWGALVASATWRKSVPLSSPLASVQEELPNVKPQTGPKKDGDGNFIMMTIDPVLLNSKLSYPVLLVPSSSTTSVANAFSPVISFKDIIRHKITKRITRPSSKLPEGAEDNTGGVRFVLLSEAQLHLFDFELAYKEEVLVKLLSLMRIKSMDRGYHSTVDV